MPRANKGSRAPFGAFTQIGDQEPSSAEVQASIERHSPIESNAYGRLSNEMTRIVSAQKTILSQIDMKGVIEALLLIAIESVAAERGLLFLAHGAGLEIEAEATKHLNVAQVLFSPDLPVAPKFSQSVLRYVVRFEERVVLQDASDEYHFSRDEYLNGEDAHSIVCCPLLAQRNLVGALYLENSQAPDAFAVHRLAFLEALVSHASIALKAATLEADLHTEAGHRRKAEEELEHIRAK